MSQFRDHIAATAHRQTASAFFDKLPAEIRQKIYDDLWDLHQTRWHVDSYKGHAVPVFPCITCPDEEDLRYKKFRSSRGDEAAVWEDRLRSPWNTHWKCAEAVIKAPSRRQRRMISPTDHMRILLHLIAPLLVCKQMYVVLLVHFQSSTNTAKVHRMRRNIRKLPHLLLHRHRRRPKFPRQTRPDEIDPQHQH